LLSQKYLFKLNGLKCIFYHMAEEKCNSNFFQWKEFNLLK
jgi:hypothetical protein